MRTPKWFLQKTPIAYLLWPLSIVYYFISKLVYVFRSFGQISSKRPVICVGNIFAGGVGKTPIVRQIAHRFHAPIVMRGYKKTGNKMGDEATMLQRDGLAVFVGNRAKNIITINKKQNKIPIIMDDGFQNPTVKKDISVLVFDESLGFGNGFVLPAGPLREPPCAIRRSDAIIIMNDTKWNVENSKLKSEILKIKPDMPVFFAANKNVIPDDVNDFIAFAGIGYPEKFFNRLPRRPIKTVAFPDHYQYTKSDLDKLFMMAQSNGATLVTTEKDWVRLPKSAQKKIKMARMETFIDPAFWNWLGGKLKCVHY